MWKEARALLFYEVCRRACRLDVPKGRNFENLIRYLVKNLKFYTKANYNSKKNVHRHHDLIENAIQILEQNTQWRFYE